MSTLLMTAGLATALLCAQEPQAKPERAPALQQKLRVFDGARKETGIDKPKVAKPNVEVVFCLDTTGSMGGLIEGAKQKIWSISNQIIAGSPTPNLKVGLLAYRDLGDQYVTKMCDLTADLDQVYTNIREYRADGGGDEPESVNQALHESLTKFKWSQDANTLRIIFLVGDAPPKMQYQNDVKYQETCKRARERGIIINAVQCGGNTNCTPVWKEIAKLAGGSYVAIGQDGGQVQVVTPFDQRLSAINAELETSTLCYGTRDKQMRDRAFQLQANEGAKRSVKADGTVSVELTAPTGGGASAGSIVPAITSGGSVIASDGKTVDAAGVASLSTAASRAAFNARKGGAINSYDFLSDIKEGKVKLETVKEEELPDELRKIEKSKRQEFLNQLDKKRTALQAEARELADKRDSFVKDAMKKQGKTGFDQEVQVILRAQAKQVGINY